ncbi:APC family permease [Bacillus norwichensis]|uniref:APC family permease n=1 Tax=Bacillus norwichensis TaxID=2762217 RepID=A0ABR8VQZ3_9BACI|nr:APC family permease [Bacillus norwichensis]MBD8007201.1 APC family permease [Bacillus norwichensis]
MSQQLNRTLGLGAAVATGVGIVVSSSALVSLGQGFGEGGKGFIIAMFAALILNMFVVFSFAELSGMIPVAGGINHYTLPAMGRFVGMISVISGYVLVTIFSGSAEAGIAGLVFTEVFAPGLNPTVISIAITAILGFINILGIKAYSWTQIILTIILIGSTIVLGIMGLTGIGVSGEPAETSFKFNEMGWGVFGLTALAIWLFIGVEFVTPLAEEIKKPKIYVPLAMGLSLLVILFADILFGLASVKFVPLDILAGSAAPHVDFATAMMGRPGQTWMGLVAIIATTSTLNTLIAAISRMLYGMGQNGQMPKIFGKASRFGTPYAAIITLCMLFVVFLLAGVTTGETIVTFILAGCFCWLVTYIIAHVNVIILRSKYPNAKRSFKSPLGVTFQVLGIMGMVYVMFNMHPDPIIKGEIYKYSLWFLAATFAYSALWVKFVMKKPLFETTPLEELTEGLHETSDVEEIKEISKTV